MNTIYITGATGHLGRNIIIELLNNSNDSNIVAMVLPNDKIIPLENEQNKITYVEGNILSKDDVNKFLNTNHGEHNYVIHCAGLISIYKKKDPKVYEVNINGTKNMLEESLSHKIDKFIYISSVDAIKKPEGKNAVIFEPDSFNPDDVKGVYGKSKAIASNLVLSYNKLGLNTLTIHPSALLGPNDYFKGPINSALTKFVKGQLKVIVTGGYDLVDVRDVAKGIVSSIKNGRPSSSYILCGYKLKIKELINLSAKVTGKPSYLLCISSNIVKIFAPLLEFFSKIRHKKPLFTAYSMDCLHQNCNYSSKKAIDELNYTNRPFEETLKDTFDWIYKNKWDK